MVTIILTSDDVAIRPDIRDGIGYCTYDDCPEFDGKRCAVMGFRPGQTCEPWELENPPIPTKTSTRADQIDAEFEVFHKFNPKVFRLFVFYTFKAIQAGREHYSADAICHRIRWHHEIENRSGEFKLNNNFVALYARRFHETYPEHDGFFKTRKRTSKEREVTHEHDSV